MRCSAAGSYVLLVVMSSLPAAAHEPEAVIVVNLPEVQQIEGTVALEDAPRPARLVRLAEVIVSPVSPAETTALVPGGVLSADGFASAVLSLGGRMRADHYRSGVVGALLIPDQEALVRAFEETGTALFPLRLEARAGPPPSTYFASEQPAVRLGFPRYRVYFHNTTDRPAAVTLWAYLVN